MVDLAGRKYKDLPHAFGYRKALVQGCACKPVPWSYEEAARHRQYEVADGDATAATDQAELQQQNASGKSAETVPEEPVHAGQATADAVAHKPSETYEPIRIKQDRSALRRRKSRDVRTITRRVAFQPASGWGIFGSPKSKNKWKVD